jgi:hypothetical protein
MMWPFRNTLREQLHIQRTMLDEAIQRRERATANLCDALGAARPTSSEFPRLVRERGQALYSSQNDCHFKVAGGHDD